MNRDQLNTLINRTLLCYCLPLMLPGFLLLAALDTARGKRP